MTWEHGNDLVHLLAIEMVRYKESFSQWIAPKIPLGTKELRDEDQVQIMLSAHSEILPVTEWRDAELVHDFRMLLKEFQEQLDVSDGDLEYLDVIERRDRRIERSRPDLAILPGDPDYDRMKRRMRDATRA